MLLRMHACLNTRVFVLFLSAADFPKVAITASVLSVNAQKLSQGDGMKYTPTMI